MTTSAEWADLLSGHVPDDRLSRKPFLSGPAGVSSVGELADWLREHGDMNAVVGGDYTVAALLADLDEMTENIWQDGIDAMGEDS